MSIELFPFRFRDPVTGKWQAARYRATLVEIAGRYDEWAVTGPPEIRETGAAGFTPWARPAQPPAGAELPPQMNPHLDHPAGVDHTERRLVALFLHRYIIWCARRRRVEPLPGALQLLAEISRTGGCEARGSA